MAQKARKTQHSDPKTGRGADWDGKAYAKAESKRRRREEDKRAAIMDRAYESISSSPRPAH
jgi:hypothetical protein